MSRTIDVEVGPGSISPAALADIEKFEQMLALYLAGDLDEDRFRIFRLNNGIYGQRQGGHNQMVRIKVPYGAITAEQLDMMAHISETYSRGWGHITTRQNIQFHFVDLERVPALHARPGQRRDDEPGGLRRHRPQRHGLPPGRRLPLRGARHQPVGRGRLPALPAPRLLPAPAPQVQDQLLRLRHRLRPGHVQRRRRHRRQPAQGRRRGRARVPGLRRRRPGRQPPPGPGPRGVHVPRGPAGHPRGVPAHVRPLRQPRQQAPGPHEVAGRHPGHRRAAAPDHQGAAPAAGHHHLARRRPRLRHRARRRAGGRRPTPSPSRPWARTSAPTWSCGPPTATAGGTKPTWCGARPRARCRPWPTPAWATSPPPSSGPSPTSSASSAARCGSPTARTSCSGASPRTS